MSRQRSRIAGILTLAGTPSYFLCDYWHICMAGHMQHGPYAWYEWASDFWWMLCFVCVLIFSLKLRAKGKVLLVGGSLVLIFSRIVFESTGGGAILLEAPLLAAMDIYALGFFFWPDRFDRPALGVPSTEQPVSQSSA